MTAPTEQPRKTPIDWQFQISEQGNVSRYGLMGKEHFKQFLPFGVHDPLNHPPKRIDKRLYDLAFKKAVILEGRTII